MTMFSLPAYDPHTLPHHNVTTPQLALLLIWIASLLLWILRLPKGYGNPDNNNKDLADIEQAPVIVNNGEIKQTDDEESAKVVTKPTSEDLNNKDSPESNEKKQNFSSAPKQPTFNEFLVYLFTLGFILIYFYLCDYYKILPEAERTYSRDTFLFLVFLLFLMGSCTIRSCSPQILSRHLTEEWKGWMQVMFVWYHYFAAKEWYNWIRIYIACYVWMTGFGNFSFFWIRKDYSLWRILKMLFRLNFLVLLVCAATSNEFMLYYICAMHTYWFLSVYATMAILPSWNTHRWKMAVKLVLYFVGNCIIFDIPGVASIVFKPLWFILGFNDGHEDIMHEWVFRAGLDHWACFIGMICAYNYPYFEAMMKKLESQDDCLFMKIKWGHFIKALIGAVVLAVFMLWFCFILPLEKFSYNAVHPYTSWIPILTYIYFRNISVLLRSKYLFMFAWLGRITLETYLSQLHIYLQSNAKHLIGYFSGYPLLNFAFATAVYIPISNALFHITVEISAYLLPKESAERNRKLLATAGTLVTSALLGKLLNLYFNI